MIQLAGDLANKPGVKSNAQKIQTYLSAVWQEAHHTEVEASTHGNDPRKEQAEPITHAESQRDLL